MGAVLLQDLDGKDRVIELGSSPITIGRALECSLRSDDPRISRQHAKIWMENDMVWVEDLGSHNGVYVGGAKVGRSLVGMGEMILVGSMVLRRVHPGGDVPPLSGMHDVLAEMLAVERRLRHATEIERDNFHAQVRALRGEAPLPEDGHVKLARASRNTMQNSDLDTDVKAQPSDIVKLRIQLTTLESARDVAETHAAAVAAERSKAERKLARAIEQLQARETEIVKLRSQVGMAMKAKQQVEVSLGKKVAEALGNSEAKLAAMAAELAAAHVAVAEATAAKHAAAKADDGLGMPDRAGRYSKPSRGSALIAHGTPAPHGALSLRPMREEASTLPGGDFLPVPGMGADSPEDTVNGVEQPALLAALAESRRLETELEASQAARVAAEAEAAESRRQLAAAMAELERLRSHKSNR